MECNRKKDDLKIINALIRTISLQYDHYIHHPPLQLLRSHVNAVHCQQRLNEQRSTVPSGASSIRAAADTMA